MDKWNDSTRIWRLELPWVEYAHNSLTSSATGLSHSRLYLDINLLCSQKRKRNWKYPPHRTTFSVPVCSGLRHERHCSAWLCAIAVWQATIGFRLLDILLVSMSGLLQKTFLSSLSPRNWPPGTSAHMRKTPSSALPPFASSSLLPLRSILCSMCLNSNLSLLASCALRLIRPMTNSPEAD